jgi:uncharacterized protein
MAILDSGNPGTMAIRALWQDGSRVFIFVIEGFNGSREIGTRLRRTIMAIDDKTKTELEAAVYRRLVEHLRTRTDVQNIDLMNLAGFCRNCLSNWMKDAADAKGAPMSREQSREIVYGMPYDEWRAKFQKEASTGQKAAFEKASQKH